MAVFFRKWKNHQRHAKMTDDWLLSNSSKNLSDYDDKQMYNENVEFEIFQVKYLGSIDIEMPHSKQITATAIKRLIALAKATNKKLLLSNLSMCPRGIMCADALTGEIILRSTINKISYCSADATHATVFAFVAETEDCSEPNTLDSLQCHAFVCAKRKMAQVLSLTVAKNFDRAYVEWQRVVEHRGSRRQLVSNSNDAGVDSGEYLCDCNNDENSNDQVLVDLSTDTQIEQKNHQEQRDNWVVFDSMVGL